MSLFARASSEQNDEEHDSSGEQGGRVAPGEEHERGKQEGRVYIEYLLIEFVIVEEFKLFPLEGIDRPCQIKHHGDFHDFVDMQLQGPDLDDAARSVDFY